ncbi:MAG: hypothetical protein KC736_01310 [Candidatus Moranbacteria bacterium]|nr:hypothetical protein [Candidatus Moranbacteria bacterium]
MCEVCDFYEKLTPAEKANPAIQKGERTIHGYYDSGDAAILARFYPKTGEELIDKIARLINHPRLLEVAGLVELLERYLEKSFSTIRGVTMNVVSNPLSVLFWSRKNGTVHRVKTKESELLHGAMEKMALRRGSLDEINALLGQQHGVALTYGCSCCGIAVAKDNLPALYTSDYYQQREGFGRLFDSDVLTASGELFEGVSVSDVPQAILDASADFGPREVTSYIRFAKAANAVVEENPVKLDLSAATEEVRKFLLGEDAVAIAA